MNRKKPQISQPIEVSDVMPMVYKSSGKEKLKGFTLSVTYDGFGQTNKSLLSDMGFISGGYASSWSHIDFGGDKKQTVVEYVFRSGLLYPEPCKRANQFRKNVLGMIENFVPVRVSDPVPYMQLDLFDELFVAGFCVIVSYPIAAQNNPYFKKFITRGKPKIARISSNESAGFVNVEYLVKHKKSKEEAMDVALKRAEKYADEFRKKMVCRIKDENTK